MSFIVAIDGPAGTGKSTITKLLSKKLNLANINTGSMYRCVTLECLKNNIRINEIEKIESILKNININFKIEDEKEKVILNNEDVTEKIRSKEVDENVAKFAALKIVRDKMTPLQRELGQKSDIILEGRDIGTVVFPNADVKIFLDCSVEERAKRRYKQNLDKGITTYTYEQVLENIKERHKLETEREIAPLKQAQDAIYIDSTELTIKEVASKIEQIILSKRNV